jgi:hypothetical protein
MKMRFIPLLAMAATAAAIGFAPVAAAAPTATTILSGSHVVQTPGNAEVTATPGAAAQHAAQLQYPFYAYGGLLFHHGGHK